MSKKSIMPQSPRHIMVYDEDWEFLQMAYGKDSPSKLGISSAIQAIIHKRVMEVKARYYSRLDQQAVTDEGCPDESEDPEQ